jgi:hypothetical protein
VLLCLGVSLDDKLEFLGRYLQSASDRTVVLVELLGIGHSPMGFVYGLEQREIVYFVLGQF